MCADPTYIPIQRTVMTNATQASQAVVDYFRVVAGAVGPIGFSVQKTEVEGDRWFIECSYFEHIGARDRTSYRVEVDKDTGDVVRVEAIRPA